MFYELWDLDSGNMVGDYPSIAEALKVLRDAVTRDGERTVASLALLESTAAGTPHSSRKSRRFRP